MSNKTTFTVEGIAKLDISQVKGAVDQMKKGFQGITLPAGIDKRVAQIFSQMTDEIAEFEVKSKNATTNADWSRVLSSGQKIMTLYQKLQGQVRQLGDLSEKEMQELFPPEVVANIKKAETALKDYQAATKKNTAEIQKQENELAKLQQRMAKKQGQKQQIESKKVVSGQEYTNMSKESKVLGQAAAEAKAHLDSLIQKQKEMEATLNQPSKSSKYRALTQEVQQAQIAYETATAKATTFETELANTTTVAKQKQALDGLEQELRETQQAIDAAQAEIQSLGQGNTTALNNLFNALSQIKGVDMTNVPHTLEGVQMVIDQLNAQGLTEVAKQLQHIKTTAESAQPAFQGLGQNIDKTTDSLNDMTSMKSQVDQLKNNFMHFFSLTSGWMLLRRGIRQAYEAVKELDDAMTEIAVVSEYTLDDIWAMRDGYTKAASDMGASTIDLVNATKLYVQQGLDLKQAQEIGIETTKMARIANLDGAEATNLMTAALRGFNMEMSEANRVNDVYSQLAAKSAADTEEIATAMSKTASIAANAGASFENTSAFLTQIIETTREAPETAGTALKTIIARFQELKKAPSEIGEVDGEMVDANKIETALKTAGVELRNAQGEFRNFDDVIIELAGKWNSLDVMTQRYIATMAAGSRQQSRFIALMADSERLMELTGYAANSAGASNDQFNKTLDSLKAKINKLKNAWSLYLQNLANNQIIKGVVDMLTLLLETVNKITSTMPGFTGSILQAILTFAAFKAAGALINKAFGVIGTMLFKQGQTAGMQYSTGVQSGLLKSQAGIKNVLKKIRALFTKEKWIGKGYTIKFKADPKALVPYKNAMEAVNAAQTKYNATAASTTATNEMKKQSENELTAALASRDLALKTMGVSETEYNALQGLGLAQDELEVALTNKDVRAKLLEIAATKGLSDEEKKAAISQALINTQQQMGLLTQAKYLIALLFGSKATRQQALDALAAAGAMGLKTAADGTATGAQWALNAAIYACPLGWLLVLILAVVAALAILAVAMANAIETDAERLDRLTKNAEEAEEAANKASDAYENLRDSISEWEDGIDQIGEMTAGTQEFRDAIIESNTKALELLDTYEALANGIRVGENGLITFSQESIDQAMAQAQMRQAITAANAQFANTAVKEEKDRQAINTRRTSGDFTFIQMYEADSVGNRKTDSKVRYITDRDFTTLIDSANKIRNDSSGNYTILTDTDGNLNGVKNGENRYQTITTTLTEDEIRDIANQFKNLEAGTDSYNKAVQELSDTYDLEDAALRDLIIDSLDYDQQLEQSELALEQLNKAAITAALSLSGIVQKDDDKEIIIETIDNALTESAYDWAVGGDKTTATYMGDTAIGGSGDSAGTGMQNFQKDFKDVMAAQGQAVNFTNTNSEGQTLIEMAKAIDPNKEIKYAAGDKHVDDEGEGLGDEFKQTARTVIAQKSALILQDAMYAKGNEDLYNMLQGGIGAASLDYNNLKKKIDAAAGDRAEDYSNLVMAGIYQTEQDQQEARNKIFDKIGAYFGSSIYDADEIADEYKAMEDAATALEDAYAAGESNDAIAKNLEDYAKAVTDYEKAINDEAKELYGENGIFGNEDELMDFSKITAKMSDQMGSALAAGFSSLENNTEVREEFIEYFANVEGSAIATATAIREMSKSSNKDLRDAAGAMTVFAAEAISAKDQVHELYDLIGQETIKELAQDGGITATEMLELAKSNDKVQQTLDNTGISAHSLAKYYELLENGTIDLTTTSEQFVLVLDKLNAAAATIEDTFAFIDTFEPSRSSTEIGTYFNDIRSSMQELINKGAYGDQQLFDYAEAVVGQEELQKLIDTYGDLDIVMQKVMERAQFGENFYSSWSQLANIGSDMVSMGAGGSVQFNLENIDSVEALEQEIMSKLNVSEIVAKAMIGDAQTFSANLKQGLNRLSLGDALGAWLDTAKVVGKKHILDKKELGAIAKQSGIDPEKIIEALEEQLGEDAEIVVEPTVTVSGTLTDTGNDLIDEFFDQSHDLNQTYKMMIDMGMNDTEAQKKLNELINDTNNVEFTFNGESVGQATDEVRAELLAKVATGIAEGNLDPIVAAAQQYSAAQQAAGLSKGVAMGVAAGLGSAYSAFIHGLPPIVQGWLGGDEAIEATMNTLIEKASTAADEASKKEVTDTLNKYNAALAQQQAKNNSTTGNEAAKKLTGNTKDKANAYTNSNSQLGTGRTFDDNKTSEPDKWQEDYDWLYNLEKKIAKTVRERNKLENEYNLLLTKGNVTQKALLENLRKQEALENKQLSQLEEERTKRQAEAKALQKEFSDVSKYVSWNSKEQRVVIDEGKMRADQDSLAPEFGERIDQAVEEFERIQDELEQIEDDTDDIKTTQAERLREQLDQYAELESRVIDALVSEREKEIEAMEKMNDVISEANSDLLDKIQTGIDDARNAREIEEAETDIQDMEQRLALMRSDTSGANALDILKLEEELQQARQDLMDSKIDQAIDELSRQNEIAQKQREIQIERASEQLEVDKETGRIADQANKMLTNMVVKGGSKSIEDLLKSQDSWKSLGAEQKKQWVDELTTQITGAIIGRSKGYAVSKTNKKGDTITFTDKNNKQQKGTLQADGTIKVGNTTYSNVFLGADGKYYQKAEGKITNTSKPAESKPVVPQSNTSNGATDVTDLVKKRVALAIWNNASSHGWGSGDTRKNKLQEVFGNQNAKAIQSQVNRGWKTLQKEAGSFKYSDYSYTNMKNKNWKKYETGGLADFTGPAWLDGTKARPEYVLNAEQTQAFLKLVNMLGDFDDNQTAGGNNYYDIKIEVDELANDYDVEQLMDKMKRLIADDAAYRNVNSINLGRR